MATQAADAAAKTTTRDPRQERRKQRFAVRRAARSRTNNKRVAGCGRPGRREDGSVVLKISEHSRAEYQRTGRVRTAGLGGLFTCGNVWLCAECSVKVAAARATELERLMGYFVERGGTVDLITLTMRHHKGQRLKQCWDGVSDAWRAVTSGGAWLAEQKALDVAGPVRSIEVTHGFRNGWHVHAHVVIIYNGQPTLEQRRRFAEGMFKRWSASLVGSGFEAPEMDNHGLDVQHLDWSVAEGKRFESITAMAKYVTKGLATETTLGAQKSARNGNRSMMALLSDAVMPHELTTDDGRVIEAMDETALDLWHEYERASKGRKQLTFARRLLPLRKQLAETADMSDEAIAEQELGGDEVAVLPRRSFDVIETRVYQLLDAAEDGGRDAAYAWLTAAGIEWHRPTRNTGSQLIEYQRYEDKLMEQRDGDGTTRRWGKPTR